MYNYIRPEGKYIQFILSSKTIALYMLVSPNEVNVRMCLYFLAIQNKFYNMIVLFPITCIYFRLEFGRYLHFYLQNYNFLYS